MTAEYEIKTYECPVSPCPLSSPKFEALSRMIHRRNFTASVAAFEFPRREGSSVFKSLNQGVSYLSREEEQEFRANRSINSFDNLVVNRSIGKQINLLTSKNANTNEST